MLLLRRTGSGGAANGGWIAGAKGDGMLLKDVGEGGVGGVELSGADAGIIGEVGGGGKLGLVDAAGGMKASGRLRSMLFRLRLWLLSTRSSEWLLERGDRDDGGVNVGSLLLGLYVGVYGGGGGGLVLDRIDIA